MCDSSDFVLIVGTILSVIIVGGVVNVVGEFWRDWGEFQQFKAFREWQKLNEKKK